MGLKVKTLPVLSRIIAKLDVKPVIQTLKNADVFKGAKDKKQAVEELKGEKAMELGFEIIAEITPQLDKIGDDLYEFIALYKGVDREAAGELDLAEIASELFFDEGIRNFFSTALRRKTERDA